MFKLGDFTSHSGTILHWKIDCDTLGLEDWECIASVVANHLPVFGAVEGVPRGGLCFARALEPYVTSGPLLIVDDVLTTGGSMEDHRDGRPAMGVVLFARDQPPRWIRSVFRSATGHSLLSLEELQATACRPLPWR